jgi:hypothetical protein
MSKALFHELKPKDAGFEITGYGMKKSEFAFLASRETKRVDQALIAMSVAEGEAEVLAIFKKLHKDTVTALFSRWVHYTSEWKKMVHEEQPHLWLPPEGRDVWRAIFLAMTSDSEAATKTCKQIWPEVFGE